MNEEIREKLDEILNLLNGLASDLSQVHQIELDLLNLVKQELKALKEMINTVKEEIRNLDRRTRLLL